MKKSVILFFSALVIISVAFASCASSPKKEEALPEEPTITEQIENVEEVITVDSTSELENVENAKKAALDANADKIAPIQFAAADALYQGLKAQAQTGVNVIPALKDAEQRFEALEKYAKAVSAKQRVDELQFASNDSASYEKGVAAINELSAIFNDTNITGAKMLEKATEAYGCFNSILINSFKKLAKASREETFKSKKNADSVKAGVAEKVEYNKAAEEFRKGDSNFAMQNPEGALKNYEASKAMFDSLFQVVSEKRKAAEKAMEEAKQAVLKMADYALSADKEAPITEENVEGIEAEDAVLLEVQEFQDPTTLEAQIPEEIEDVSSEESVEENVELDSKEQIEGEVN